MLDPNKYDIWPLDQVKYVERDEFIQKLLTKVEAPEIPVEDQVMSIWDDIHMGVPVKAMVDVRTVHLAQDYIRYRDQGARLPKFSKWASSMFKDDKQLAKDLAAAGKATDKGAIVISGDIVDILRCADTKHFSSCFAYKGGEGYYKEMPKHICEDTPGIAIAYIDDDEGKMRGRVWVHHAQRIDTGEDVAVVCQQWAGSLDAKQVCREIQKMGIPAFHGGSYGNQAGDVQVRFINCFKKALHHDMYTWLDPFRVTSVK